ncbi:hypothetical protein ACVMII_005411 [Bradyrhizobium diazoefficiens]
MKVLLNELKSRLSDKSADLPEWDDECHRRSMQLLAVIDELDKLIAAESTDKASRRKLRQARSRTAQELATHLDGDASRFASAFIVANDHRNVWAVLEITGTPSRAGREQADEWTALRGHPWRGDIKKLRAMVRQAATNGEKLPPGQFGLRIQRTIKIGQWSGDDAREFENSQPPLDPDERRTFKD